MGSSSPRVTIGVPVYNGIKFIRATLDSLLAQTYRDFELIICDNASTDSTPEICAEYAAADSRIRIIRHPKNIGPAANYNSCVEHACGELFKWNAADDCCAPEFLEKCVAELDANPDTVLVYPRTRQIDENGKVFNEYAYELDHAADTPHQRLWRLVSANHRIHGAHELFGIIRMSALKATPCFRMTVRGDSVLLARLALQGKFRRVEDYLFYNRDHSNRSSKYIGRRQVRAGSKLSAYIGCGPLPPAEWWDITQKGKINFPEWRVLSEYILAVKESPVTGLERAMCYLNLARFSLFHIPKLVRDLIIATEQGIRLMVGGSLTPPAPKASTPPAPVPAPGTTPNPQ